MNIPAALTIVALVLLAALHFYWGVGGRWPGHDDRSLVEMVIGRTRNMKAPDFWTCLFVTLALLSAALLVALYVGMIDLSLSRWADLVVALGYCTAGAVFFARGVAGFIPAVFRYAEGTPFARLNRLFYSPLCLAVAAGFVAAHFATRI